MHKSLWGMKMGDVMRAGGEIPVGAPGGMVEAGCECGCPGCGVDCGCSCCEGVSDVEHCPKCGGGLMTSGTNACSCEHEEIPVITLTLGEAYCAKCESAGGPCDECGYMDEKTCSECGSWMEEGVCSECGGIYPMTEVKKSKNGRKKSKGPSKKTAQKILKGTKTFAAKMKKVSGWAENPPAAAAWMMKKATGKWPRES